MSALAAFIGYFVLISAVAAATLFAGLVFWAWFPVRFDIHRDTPTFLDTPHGKLNLNLFVGISGRRKARWMFGFLLLGRDGEKPRRARVLATKRARS